MDKKYIIAIGGAVIKTARYELIEAIQIGKAEILIHNGGSIFHDFQLATEILPNKNHSYPISELMNSRKQLKKTSNLIKDFYKKAIAPTGSITHLCQTLDIPVLIFTGLACDWWQFEFKSWNSIAFKAKEHFEFLKNRFASDKFNYLCMGSAVIHPEVFLKALALSGASNKQNWFTADVVDFLDMYRPRTRVSIYGKYYQMEHRDFLNKLNKGELP
jgi:hypothetical protein